MKILWMTDIHLDHCSKKVQESFVEKVAAENADVVLISGDIGLTFFKLCKFNEESKASLLYVFGNHDFYYKSIEKVQNGPYIIPSYLSKGPTPFENVIFLGHDSFADWGYGDPLSSCWHSISDFHWIDNLLKVRGDIPAMKKVMQFFAKKAVDYLDKHLIPALDTGKEVYFVTHVPPFRECCLYEGQISGDDFLPFFSCKAVGDKLLEIMNSIVDKRLTVLCGHTHEEADVNILPNLRVRVQGAEYGNPNYIILNEVNNG